MSIASNIEEMCQSMPPVRGKLLLGEPMSLHTSYKVGGPADIFLIPADASDLEAVAKWAHEKSLPIFMIGAGTNLLVSDKGIRGLVVQLGPGFGGVHVRGTEVIAGAAVTLSTLLRRTLGAGLSGLEGLAGIPGTVGGAVCMNAGTPTGCVKDTLVSVSALTFDGQVREVPAADLGLRYRGSSVGECGLVVLEATFILRRESPEGLRKIVAALMSKRRQTQPVGIRSAGSVFKNPEGGYAGRLLEEVGAKGMQIGGARVSSKHANFILNTGIATAQDIYDLMMRLKGLVKERFGVELEPEIQLVGEW